MPSMQASPGSEPAARAVPAAAPGLAMPPLAPAAAPGFATPPPAAPALVEVENLTVHFPAGRAGFWGGRRLTVHAVEDVSFAIGAGETLGLVGESGSGKTTAGRAILRRLPATRGRIRFRGADITEVRGEPLRNLREHMQLVFQDPYASLNPRMRVLDIVAEPLLVHGRAATRQEAADKVGDLLRRVGLPGDAAQRYPHAFSGGQRQRIGIARALVLRPSLVVLDEPVSALDVSVQAQILNLLVELKEDFGLSYLFISHDLSVVRYIADRVMVMSKGQIVETGSHRDIWDRPQHPYTRSLIAAVPGAEQRKAA